ncbi:unnamed protein product [Polarella glacialis]|uniref:Casein kinase substrate phosphoprotein PP28 domain-containing protein n=1 Tax=Polarella glacialis TaxID=89957 RepID=A0A813GIG7_POLGL|nr:unnamed protein product [Polarella glacialis]
MSEEQPPPPPPPGAGLKFGFTKKVMGKVTQRPKPLAGSGMSIVAETAAAERQSQGGDWTSASAKLLTDDEKEKQRKRREQWHGVEMDKEPESVRLAREKAGGEPKAIAQKLSPEEEAKRKMEQVQSALKAVNKRNRKADDELGGRREKSKRKRTPSPSSSSDEVMIVPTANTDLIITRSDDALTLAAKSAAGGATIELDLEDDEEPTPAATQKVSGKVAAASEDQGTTFL